jgi:hypothetical protein
VIKLESTQKPRDDGDIGDLGDLNLDLDLNLAFLLFSKNVCKERQD